MYGLKSQRLGIHPFKDFRPNLGKFTKIGKNKRLNRAIKKQQKTDKEKLVKISMKTTKYNRYVHPKIIDLNDKQVCIIKVNSSIKPVFLKNSDKDEFYISASASSQPLNVMESNSYIDKHWGGN